MSQRGLAKPGCGDFHVAIGNNACHHCSRFSFGLKLIKCILCALIATISCYTIAVLGCLDVTYGLDCIDDWGLGVSIYDNFLLYFLFLKKQGPKRPVSVTDKFRISFLR